MSKRPLCTKCGFILVRCLCETLKTINNNTQLIILQHPSETDHALNTVALMKKSFQNITIFIGEDFSSNDALNALINTHKNSMALLFPTEKSTPLKSGSHKKITHLILIDGTWKKAHKIFTLSQNLHQLDCFKLEIEQSGGYIIRSSKIKHALSTLEASINALSIVEEKLETESLANSFKKMIEFQIEKMGPETFIKNYKNKNQKEKNED